MTWPFSASALGRRASGAAWRRRAMPELPVAAQASLRVGRYLVGEAGDPQLQGHPNIRY
ncbi:hypothetical protein [Hymenobacter armeniacus]|uniref:hypothetical protein n=1 Tax=Hymenobacter armeniacus TaxID=2771358 RepID=UPI00168429B4|nr:hypothetical protein [Hymenobacter armeniacus]